MSNFEWDDIAKYWDLFSGDRVVDIDFWVDCAKQYGSPVLEFACGTGRLTLPIARAGVSIVGIDISKPMISITKRKLLKEPKKAQHNVTLIIGNANSFSIPNSQFSAIFSPWGFPPITQREQSSLFQAVKKHLKPGGIFIIDEFNFKDPKNDTSSFYIKDYRRIPEKNITVVRQVQQRTNASEKTNHFLYLWDIISSSGSMKRIITERTERIYTRKDMEQHIKENGLFIVEEYGNYDKTRWSSDSPRTIIIASKK